MSENNFSQKLEEILSEIKNVSEKVDRLEKRFEMQDGRGDIEGPSDEDVAAELARQAKEMQKLAEKLEFTQMPIQDLEVSNEIKAVFEKAGFKIVQDILDHDEELIGMIPKKADRLEFWGKVPIQILKISDRAKESCEYVGFKTVQDIFEHEDDIDIILRMSHDEITRELHRIGFAIWFD